MLSRDGVLFVIFLLINCVQAIPRSTPGCPGGGIGPCLTEEPTCQITHEFCGEKQLVCKNVEVTITYYKIACPKLEEFTFTYESCATNLPKIVHFTKEFTNFVIGEQPICDVSLRYTSAVTFDILQTQYSQEFCFAKPQKLEEVTVCLCIQKQVTMEPETIDISFVYTVLVTEKPQKVRYTLTFDYTPVPRISVLSKKIDFTVAVSQAAIMEQTQFTYVVVVTKAPVKRTAVKVYSIEVTQAVVVTDINLTPVVEAPGEPVYETVVFHYSVYVTSAPHVITHTERFTYYVANIPEVTEFSTEIPYYITGGIIKKTNVCKFTYYPPAPLQTEVIEVSLTYYATVPMKFEEFSVDITAFVYGQPIQRRNVFRYTLPRRLPPQLKTVTEFEYTCYAGGEEDTTTIVKEYTTYVTKQPEIAYSVVPYTDFDYPPVASVDNVFTYTSCITKPPSEITYFATVTSFMEGDVTVCEFIEHFSYYATCEVFTKNIPIPYTTFVSNCP